MYGTTPRELYQRAQSKAPRVCVLHQMHACMHHIRVILLCICPSHQGKRDAQKSSITHPTLDRLKIKTRNKKPPQLASLCTTPCPASFHPNKRPPLFSPVLLQSLYWRMCRTARWYMRVHTSRLFVPVTCNAVQSNVMSSMSDVINATCT